MRISTLLAAGFFLFAFAQSTLYLVGANHLTDDGFRELQRELQPSPDEPWLTIPWKISLLDAQHLAAQEKKPIFIWAMDGHPLGCT